MFLGYRNVAMLIRLLGDAREERSMEVSFQVAENTDYWRSSSNQPLSQREALWWVTRDRRKLITARARVKKFRGPTFSPRPLINHGEPVARATRDCTSGPAL